MKKQTGLTIIKLMVLLLVAGIVGSFAINALIKHRCLSDPAAHMCAEKSSVQEQCTP
jgi:Tfp pilus assembly protein PilE